MSTFGQIVEDARAKLLGYVQDQELLAEVGGVGWNSSDQLLPTANDDGLTKGIVEVENELLFVYQVDKTNHVVKAYRGWGGSTTASHSAGAVVTIHPQYPRPTIRKAINETLRAVFPDLFRIASTSITFNAAQVTYQLPADIGQVLQVSAQTIGPTGIWVPIRRYRFDPNADTTVYPNGKTIDIYNPVTSGRTVRVVYTRPPLELVNTADDFTITGLPASCEDVILWGTCARLIPSIEAARLQSTAIESSERAAFVPPEAATSAARYFQALYASRLSEERDRLLRLNVVNSHLVI